MNVLEAVNILLVGLWMGMYLFTTFIVSPAFSDFFPDAQIRRARRTSVGKAYARVAGPLMLGLALIIFAQGWQGGFSAALLTEFGALLLMVSLVGWHVLQARSEQRPPPRWATHTALTAGLVLCGAAVMT
ncbi:hypothetical protein EHF33_16695 (plasmid) [Deinococcus psychrotolerans]|uniref:DUF4149 domain-containing protein n=1 Tax=Deinococcus psychrotolerans TaxID=2489213 RepID=A0A3G8YGU6_9DEIO|nr:hypothetical protein [Deinococcus psychrotolerans]AZI44549.1 hypothetical protein EHF33_16695 [Deinococcus psychrotolerans]